MRIRVRSLMVLVLVVAVAVARWREVQARLHSRQHPSWLVLVLEGCTDAMLLAVGLALMTLRPARDDGDDDPGP